jgi:hypothetical protein
MIRVTVEIVPHGLEVARKVIEQIEIVNVATNPKRPILGNYEVEFQDGTIIPVNDHLRDIGWEPILAKALNARGNEIFGRP